MDRAERDALARATEQTKEAGSIEMAAELDTLRRTRAGSYALMHALVNRIGAPEDAPIHIPRGEWMTTPPGEKLKIKIDPATNDAKVYIERSEG